MQTRKFSQLLQAGSDSCFWLFSSCSCVGHAVRLIFIRADKGWGVKRARRSKKVWCSGLGLCLEMSHVFDFGQRLRCGLCIRHCRCHWIIAPWFALLPRSFVPVRCLREANVAIFCGRCSWSRQTSLLKVFSYYFHDSTTVLYFRSTTRQCRCYSKTKTTKYCLKHEGKSHPCHPWQN